MSTILRLAGGLLLRLLAPFILLAAAGPAFAAFYVDNGMPDLTAEEKVVVSNPQPVQVLFQFQTKGADNARATKALKAQILTIIKNSGVFSEVSEGPVASGAILNVVINDTPSEGAAGKGFATGLTFGLKGSTVQDFYDLTLDYVASPTAAKITKTARHTLNFTLGAAGQPPNSTKVANANVAIETIMRQLLSRGLNSLAADPAFSGAPAPAAPEPQPAPVPVAPGAAPPPADPAAPKAA